MSDQSKERREQKQRAWYQLRLSTLMLAVLMIAIACAWWADHAQLAKQILIQSHQVKIFTLANAQAASVTAALQELYPDSDPNPVRISADNRTNSVIVRGSLDDLAVIEAILLRLDQ